MTNDASHSSSTATSSGEKPSIGDKIKHVIGLDKSKDKDASGAEHNTFTEVQGKTSGTGTTSSTTVPATEHVHTTTHGHSHGHEHHHGTNKTIDPTSHAAHDADHVPAVAYGTGSGSGTGPRAGQSGSGEFAKEVQERGVEDVIHHGSSRTDALDATTATGATHGAHHHHEHGHGHSHGHGLTGAGATTGVASGLTGTGSGATTTGVGSNVGGVGGVGSDQVGGGPGTHTVTYGKDGDPSYGSTHTSTLGGSHSGVGSAQQKTALFEGDNLNQSTAASSGLNVRPLHSDDHEHGYLDILQPLVPSQPPLTRAIFDQSFNEMHATNTSSPRPIYHVVVVEDLSAASPKERILATATLLLEVKFLRGGSIAGHIEDVSVRASAQGRGLGKLLIDTLTQLAQRSGCYKVILDCDDKNVTFYEKCSYARAGVEMKRYL